MTSCIPTGQSKDTCVMGYDGNCQHVYTDQNGVSTVPIGEHFASAARITSQPQPNTDHTNDRGFSDKDADMIDGKFGRRIPMMTQPNTDSLEEHKFERCDWCGEWQRMSTKDTTCYHCQERVNKYARDARVNALLDLEQWIYLHDSDQQQILEGIEHMAKSLLQFPDQAFQSHYYRISKLREDIK